MSATFAVLKAVSTELISRPGFISQSKISETRQRKPEITFARSSSSASVRRVMSAGGRWSVTVRAAGLTTSAARTPAASHEAIFSSTSTAVSEGESVSATKSGASSRY